MKSWFTPRRKEPSRIRVPADPQADPWPDRSLILSTPAEPSPGETPLLRKDAEAGVSRPMTKRLGARSFCGYGKSTPAP